jgi:hypothetical protein
MTDYADHTHHSDAPDDSDSSELVRAARLLKKIWDLDPQLTPASQQPPPETPSPVSTSLPPDDLALLPAEERHRRKCAVCRHPDRQEIEEDFVHWRDVWQIAKEFDIADSRSIYTHARAFGLIERRRENRRAVLDQMLEAGPAEIGAHGIIEAIRAYSCLTDDNRWVEPSRRIEYALNRPQTRPPKLEPASKAEPDTLDVDPADSESPQTLPEPSVIVHAGVPPGPLPAWDGRFTSSYGNPNR